MNTMHVRIVGVSLILSLGLSPRITAAPDEKTEHTGPVSSTTGRETKADEIQMYDAAIEALKNKINMKAIGADEKKTEKKFPVGGEEKKLAEELKVLKEYRTKLKGCEEGSSSKLIVKILDGYVKLIHDALRAEKSSSATPIEGLGVSSRTIFAAIDGENNHLISEKMVNMYALQLAKFFEKKEGKTDSSDEEKKAKEAVEKIAGILWGGSFRKDIFKLETAATDSETEKVYDENKAVIGSLEKSDKLCKDIESEKKAVSKDNDTSGPLPRGEEAAVDPSLPTGGAAGGAGGAGGAGTGSSSPTDLNAALDQFKQQLDAQNQLTQQQNLDALNERARLEQQLALQQLQQQQQDELTRALLANEQNNSDALGKLAAQALQQQPDGARSANRENSDSRSPQFSPSLDTGGRGGQQQPQIPQQQYMPPQTPQLPLSLLQPPQTPALPQQPRFFEDDMARRAPVPAQNPQSAGILELLKTQQQMMAMMMQRGMYPQQQMGGTANIYGNYTQRLAAVGGAGGRLTSSRRGSSVAMNGTASGGVPGRMGSVARARTTPPR